MLIEPTAHLDGDGTGDPAAHCERLTLTARRASAARKLAALVRITSTPEGRERLFDVVEQLDAQVEAERAAGGADHEGHDAEHPERCPHCGAARELAEALGY
ncbi:MAG TPA: hypothetical protein VGE74_18390 [Gemmata sp.]